MTDSVYVSVNKFVTSLKKVVKKAKAYVVYFDRYYKSDFNRINVPPLFIGYINEKNKLVEINEYKYNHFAPLFIASAITKNNEVVRDFGGKAEQGSLLLSKYIIKESYNEFYYNEYKYEYDATHFRELDWCRSIENVILEINGKLLQIINVHGIWNKDKAGDERTINQIEWGRLYCQASLFFTYFS